MASGDLGKFGNQSTSVHVLAFFAPARYLVGVSVRVPVSRSTTNTFIVL